MTTTFTPPRQIILMRYGTDCEVAALAIQELAEIVDDLKTENAELRAALKLPEKQKKQAAVELTAEEIEKAADAHVKAAYDNIMSEVKGKKK